MQVVVCHRVQTSLAKAATRLFYQHHIVFFAIVVLCKDLFEATRAVLRESVVVRLSSSAIVKEKVEW